MASSDPNGDQNEQFRKWNVDLSGAAARMSDIPEQAKKTGAIKKTYPNRNREMGEASTSGAAERRDDPDGRQSRNSESSNTRKHNRKNKMDKRDERSFEFIMEQVEDFSDSDKFKYLADRYKSLYEEFRKTEVAHLTLNSLKIENDHLHREIGKNIMARGRLENVCRNLQKQNKEIKRETQMQIREEETKRKEVSEKFQKTFNELSDLMHQSNERSLKLRDDNVEMADKIQILCEKSRQMEEQMNLMKKESDLEKQLYDSNAAKIRLETLMEKEQWEQERKALELSLKKSEEMRAQLQINATVLQEQIRLYIERCEDCDRTIKRSNQMFQKCKDETLGMNRKMVALENDSKTWKLEWLKRDEEAEQGKRKIVQLEKLCRHLQAERNEYLKSLRANNIPIPEVQMPTSEEPLPVPQPPAISTPKERELALLKCQLAELKNDLDGYDNLIATSTSAVDAVINENEENRRVIAVKTTDNAQAPSATETAAEAEATPQEHAELPKDDAAEATG